jgi:trans-2,3-dihydro-3-hydroxyanthranilate isomerase
MRYRFLILDVFSSTPFGGNQLAVLPDASGITAAGMQAIAREFNFSESTFVFPAADPAHTRRVRIFTPRSELPFAGHPTVGTACALVHEGHCGAGDDHRLVLEEGVGPVAVAVRRDGAAMRATLTLTARPEERPFPLPLAGAAALLSLEAGEVVQAFAASVGLPFCFVQLRSREAVDRAVADRQLWSRRLAGAWSSHIFLFAGDLTPGAELYARLFAPDAGIEEDPATGSACATLAGVAAQRRAGRHPELTLTIRQGVAMGRPSTLEASARSVAGEVVSVSVGGAAALVADGEIEVPELLLEG